MQVGQVYREQLLIFIKTKFSYKAIQCTTYCIASTEDRVTSKQSLEISTTATAVALSKEETKAKLKELNVKKVAILAFFVSQEKLYMAKATKINKIVKDAEKYREKLTASTVARNNSKIQTEINKYNDLATAIRNASSARTTSLVSVAPFQGFSKGSFDVGGPIRQTGLYNLHQGEYVMNQRQSRGAGGVSVNINGGVYLSHTCC